MGNLLLCQPKVQKHFHVMPFALTMHYQYLEQKEHNVNLNKTLLNHLTYENPYTEVCLTMQYHIRPQKMQLKNHYRIWSKKCFQETFSKHVEFSIFGHKNNLIKNY